MEEIVCLIGGWSILIAKHVAEITHLYSLYVTEPDLET